MAQTDWVRMYEFLSGKLALWLILLFIIFFMVAMYFERPVARFLESSLSDSNSDFVVAAQQGSENIVLKEVVSQHHAGWRVTTYLTHTRTYNALVNFLDVLSRIFLLLWPWMVDSSDIAMKLAAFLVFLTFIPLTNIWAFRELYRCPTIEKRVIHRKREELKSN